MAREKKHELMHSTNGALLAVPELYLTGPYRTLQDTPLPPLLDGALDGAIVCH